MDSLPFELVHAIFKRLPLRTLLICQGVCRLWGALLSGHPFSLAIYPLRHYLDTANGVIRVIQEKEYARRANSFDLVWLMREVLINLQKASYMIHHYQLVKGNEIAATFNVVGYRARMNKKFKKLTRDLMQMTKSLNICICDLMELDFIKCRCKKCSCLMSAPVYSFLMITIGVAIHVGCAYRRR